LEEHENGSKTWEKFCKNEIFCKINYEYDFYKPVLKFMFPDFFNEMNHGFLYSEENSPLPLFSMRKTRSLKRAV
jgi:hypothetical protein